MAFTWDSGRARGITVDGEQPKSLLLEGGDRLCLDETHGEDGGPDWALVHSGEGDPELLSVEDAKRLAGREHEEFVTIRTRAEAAWLRMVSEWFEDQADRLERDLARTS